LHSLVSEDEVCSLVTFSQTLSPLSAMTSFPVPAEFSLEEFRQRMIDEAKIRESMILSLASFGDRWIIGGTSGGLLAVWDLGKATAGEPGVLSQSPQYRFDARAGAIYDLKVHIVPNTGRNLLLAATDSGLLVFECDDIIALCSASPSSSLPPPAPLADLALPFPPQRSIRVMHPIAECNGIAVDDVASVAWLAGGDGVAHGFDLHSLAMAHRTGAAGSSPGKGQPLYCVASAPDAKQVFTGGEGGTVAIWDVRSLSRAHATLETAAASSQPSSTSAQTSNAKSGWVGAMQVDRGGNWLTVGGGQVGAPAAGSKGGPQERGYLSLWHVPSGTKVCSASSSRPIQALTYHEEALLSVGSESMVTYWDLNPSCGDSGKGFNPRGRAKASAPSLFAALSVDVSTLAAKVRTGEDTGGAMNDDGDDAATSKEAYSSSNSVLLVGGAAPVVDCFMTPSSRTFSFSLL